MKTFKQKSIQNNSKVLKLSSFLILMSVCLIPQHISIAADLQNPVPRKDDWGQTNGPYGGEVPLLFATSKGTLFLGTDDEGIFRSKDLGETWTKANVGLPKKIASDNRYVTAFAQNDDTIYVGVSTQLYKSNDDGDTWNPTHIPYIGRHISGIVIVGDHIYISLFSSGTSGRKGVWYSDNGKAWVEYNDGLTDLRIRKFSNIGTTLIVGTEKGLFRRKINEDIWQPIHSGLVLKPNEKEVELSQENINPSIARVDSIVAKDSLLYISVILKEGGGLFRSDDEGDTWTRISSKEMWDWIEGLDIYDSTLYVSCFGGTVYRSTDQGASWSDVGSNLPDGAGSGLVAINANTIFVSTEDNGIYRSTDGGKSWQETNTGLILTDVTKLVALNNTIYALSGNRLFYSASGGESWDLVEMPPEPNFEFKIAKLAAANGKLFVGAMRTNLNTHASVGGIYMIDEQKNVFTEMHIIPRMIGIESIHIEGTNIYVATHGNGLYLLNEGWNTWINLGLERKFITEITVFKKNVYARTIEGEIYLFKDTQQPWEKIERRKIEGKFAKSIHIDKKLYALSTEDGFLQSDDDGDTWQNVDYESRQPIFESMEIDGNDLYIGTYEDGVFKWNHQLARWDEIGSLQHFAQTLAAMNGYLYVGTAGKGVFRIKIVE